MSSMCFFAFYFLHLAPLLSLYTSDWCLETQSLYSFDRLFPLLSIPVMLNGTASIPPATAVNYVPWTIVGFIFQYIVRRRHFGWWSKYNCTSLSLSPFPLPTTPTARRLPARDRAREPGQDRPQAARHAPVQLRAGRRGLPGHPPGQERGRQGRHQGRHLRARRLPRRSPIIRLSSNTRRLLDSPLALVACGVRGAGCCV